MKKIISIAVILSAISALLVFAKLSSVADNFGQAEDFPRGALIYVQIRDLPALVKIWNESDFRRKYLESANFTDFQNNHLALKLAERAGEIQTSLGIFPDLGFASGLSETRAALAVYDIGKMEFVFIAPVSEEKILASKLFEMQADFEEIGLEDETVVYAKEIEVDRGRQAQKILFTNFQGRLILSTSEKYFLQTLDVIKGKAPKTRLSSESVFRQLAEKTVPRLATVWLDQEKLNDDWYFKHYWLMSDAENLKNLRAGMFDFEMQDNKLIERRVFLTTKNNFSGKIKAETANRLGKLIPEKIPFYEIEFSSKNDFGESVADVLFDVKTEAQTSRKIKAKKEYYFRDWEKSYSYSYLDNDFSEQINETEDAWIPPEKTKDKTDSDLTKIVGAANPELSLKLFSPQNLPLPLFFENRKALIFSLQNPSNLNRKELENTLSRQAQNLLTVGNQKSELVWTDFPVAEKTARQMTMPLLGWKIFYFAGGNALVFSNSEDFLKEILSAKTNAPKFADSFEKITVINLENGRETFKDVFRTLETDGKFSGNGNGSTFFTGNIGGLLDAVSDVERIEIKQASDGNFIFEEIGFVLEEKTALPDK